MARIWRAANSLAEPVWRDLTRFLIAVPCRRDEAAHMEWSQVDLETAKWRQPGMLTKNGNPHRLFLHPLALDVLRERQAVSTGDGLVFAASESGKAVDTFSSIKSKLVEASKLDGWTWRDFRRSFATALGEAGIPEALADAVLNLRQAATRGAVLGVYKRASRWPEQQQATQGWGQMLSDALKGSKALASFVPIAVGGR